VQLLDVGLVEVDLGYGGGDLGEGENAHLLPLQEQTLDFFKLLEVNDRHASPVLGDALLGRQVLMRTPSWIDAPGPGAKLETTILGRESRRYIF
jgi:hypothetical protein